MALSTLKKNHIKHKTIIVENTEKSKSYYKKQNEMNTFPQIFLQVNKDEFIKIGGNDNLQELLLLCKNIKDSNSSVDTVYHTYKTIYKK
jgi:glutaredoxin